MKNPDMPEYILQKEDDATCSLVALMNAFIFHYGAAPVKYLDKEFNMLVDIGLGNAGPILRLDLIAKLLGVQLIPQPSDRPGMSMKSWIIQNIQAGHSVIYPFQPPDESPHDTLLISWTGQGFHCVNARWTKPHLTTEWLPWERLEEKFFWQGSHPAVAVQFQKLNFVIKNYRDAIGKYHEAMKLLWLIL